MSAAPLLERRWVPLEQLSWGDRIEALVRACRRYGAVRAWIIGSAARGTADEESDLDLVIEKETSQRRIDRIGEFLADLDLAFPLDVLIYTPEELRGLLEGDLPFLTDAMAEARPIWRDGHAVVDAEWVEDLEARSAKRGKRREEEDACVAAWKAARSPEEWIVFDPSASAREWFRQAQADLAAARVLQTGNQFAAACFYAQQAGEKAIKAFLLRTGDRRLPEHGVGALTARAQARDPRFGPVVADGAFLDRFYISTRYPDAWPGGAVPAERYFLRDAQDAVAAAERLATLVEEALRDLDGPNP